MKDENTKQQSGQLIDEFLTTTSKKMASIKSHCDELHKQLKELLEPVIKTSDDKGKNLQTIFDMNERLAEISGIAQSVGQLFDALNERHEEITGKKPDVDIEIDKPNEN